MKDIYSLYLNIILNLMSDMAFQPNFLNYQNLQYNKLTLYLKLFYKAVFQTSCAIRTFHIYLEIRGSNSPNTKLIQWFITYVSRTLKLLHKNIFTLIWKFITGITQFLLAIRFLTKICVHSCSSSSYLPCKSDK